MRRVSCYADQRNLIVVHGEIDSSSRYQHRAISHDYHHDEDRDFDRHSMLDSSIKIENLGKNGTVCTARDVGNERSTKDYEFPIYQKDQENEKYPDCFHQRMVIGVRFSISD